MRQILTDEKTGQSYIFDSKEEVEEYITEYGGTYTISPYITVDHLQANNKELIILKIGNHSFDITLNEAKELAEQLAFVSAYWAKNDSKR